jgi:heterodisulfide reductase subunit D
VEKVMSDKIQLDRKKIQETNAYSCLECGKCTGVCPVSRYSKTFSPRQTLIRTLRNTHPESLKDANVWRCLTCQQCDTICPANIKYVEFTQMIRQFVGVENREGTCSHGGILESILKIMTSPDLKQQRLDWLTKDYQTSQSSEYLYFMGCLPYYDVLFTEIGVQSLNIARSMIKILNYFDIQPQIMSNEKCCGHDFYWNGDMKNFKKLAQANLEQINTLGIKYIITACAECYRTLKIDYPLLMGSQSFEVIHITEFLADKLKERNLRLKTDKMKLTYHDPCRLGRHMGIFDSPRLALSHLTGMQYREMAHHHKRAICCGVTSWMNCSQISKQIQHARLNEAQAIEVDTMVTACPKCQIHFKCALQDKEFGEHIKFQIKDFTEIFAEQLP